MNAARNEALVKEVLDEAFPYDPNFNTRLNDAMRDVVRECLWKLLYKQEGICKEAVAGV